MTGPVPREWPQAIEIIQDNSHLQGECFIWEGTTAGEGYGVIRCDNATWYIHRLVYKNLICEELPEVVMHTCDTPRCWNPEHLIGGTTLDNVLDKMQKRRHMHGMMHYRASLTPDQVLEIFHSDLQNEVLASKYNVTRGCIHGIRSGRTWKHLTKSGD